MGENSSYKKFLESKMVKLQPQGFDHSKFHADLKPFQKHLTKISIKAGRYALFADCGLGKTFMQMEWAAIMAEKTGKPSLILAPLGASIQTLNKESKKFGYSAGALGDGRKGHQFIVTNYEQLEKITPSFYGAVILDESSILKNFAGETKKALCEKFKDTQYKLCCTATPSPNDPTETGNHAEFLGICSRGDMLSRYFYHDSGNTADWILKPHAERDFYSWVASWSSFVEKPSDLGFDDEGYKLPKLNLIPIRIETPKIENGKLFNDTAVDAFSFNSELRRTLEKRIGEASELLNGNKEQWIVWVKLNQEADALTKEIEGAENLQGSDSDEEKERKLFDFVSGKIRVLVTKYKIASFGLNFQNCNNQLFFSLDFSFEGFYQAVRRSWRYGQKKPVNIHYVELDTMGNVKDSLERKQLEFSKMKGKYMATTKKQAEKPAPESDFEFDGGKLYFGDCVERIKEVGSETVGLSVFSPPFMNLYSYSDSFKDMGNSTTDDEFYQHFKFLIPELLRIIMPGRICAVHCADVPAKKERDGFIGFKDFSGQLIQMFSGAGFVYHSRITIWKDPVIEMQRTKASGLLYKQLRKDSGKSRVGNPDYVLLFRKPGQNANPIQQNIDLDTWQKWASPVWMDIEQGRVLNYRFGRDEKDEKHICPLQLDVIERLIHLWSNPGDLVFSPFAGIGSEIITAIACGRRGAGIELKQSYFTAAKKFLAETLEDKKQLQLAI